MEALLAASPATTVVLSSHDLAEIESFVAHVAFLNEGVLEFEEELTSLTARFREITVILDADSEIDPWPGHWINRETCGSSVRFVETQFDTTKTGQQIRAEFTGIQQIETAAMSLRSIFVALARSKTTRS